MMQTDRESHRKKKSAVISPPIQGSFKRDLTMRPNNKLKNRTHPLI